MTRYLVAYWQGEKVSALQEPCSAAPPEEWHSAARWYAAMAGCEIRISTDDRDALRLLAARFDWRLA